MESTTQRPQPVVSSSAAGERAGDPMSVCVWKALCLLCTSKKALLRNGLLGIT